MSLDISILTAAAVLVHLGVGLAGAFLKDGTDKQKLAAIDTKTDQIVQAVVTAAPVIAAAVPTTTPKTLTQVAGDLANMAAALAALSAPATAPTAPPTGGASHAG